MNTVGQALSWLVAGENWAGRDGIALRLVEHLGVTVLAVVLAAVVALPIGVLVGHFSKGVGAVAGTVGAMRAVPSLGVITLVALLVGVGLVAPVTALVILALPSLLAGAYAGVAGVDATVVDAARAMGMTRGRIIRQVQLPLAAPVILGGVRSATLQVVSTTTLAAYTADVGLGRFLFTGLKTNDYALTMASALLVIVLAVFVDVLLVLGNKLLSRRVSTV